MQVRTTTARLAVAGMAVALGATACGKSTSSGGGTSGLKTGGTLKIIAESDVGNLDTQQAYEVVAWTLFRAVTRQLVSYAGSTTGLKDDVATKPDLASKIDQSADGLTYTFHLRNNIHFSGPTNRAIVANDFIYAIKRLCDPNGASGAIGYYTATIKGLDSYCTGFGNVKTGSPAAVKAYIDGHSVAGLIAKDASTLEVDLKQKAGDFLNIMALPFATPVAEEVLAPYLTDSPGMRQHFVSSGPYYIASYVPDKSYTFKRALNYDKAGDPLRAAYADQIVVDETAGNDAAEFQQITAGTQDLSLDVTTPPAPLVRSLRTANDPTLRITPEGRVDYMVFNLKPTDNTTCGVALRDVRVRQAFNYAVNKQDIVQIKGGSNSAFPTGQILTSTITGYVHSDPYSSTNSTGDIVKAKALLAAAGYSNGLTCSFIYRPKNKGGDIATTLKQDVARAGITLKLDAVPNKDFYAKHLQLPSVNDWDVAAPGWSPDWQGNAARTFFLPLLSKKYSPCEAGTTNYGCYGTAAIDSQVDAALAAANPKDLWAGVDAAVMANPPWVPLVEENAVTISSSRIKGFRWFNFADNADIANVSVL